MLNSTTTPSNKHAHKINSGKTRLWATGAVLCLTYLVVVFGLIPDANLFWSHCRVAEWGVLTCIIILFIKNWWLKAFLLWNLLSTIIVFLNAPAQAGAGAFIAFYYLFLFGVFYQILYNILDKNHTRIVINGLCVIALLQTIYITFQHFKLDPFFEGMIGTDGYKDMDVKDLVVGTWAHTNFAGAYLACSIPLFLRKRWFWFIPFIGLAMFWGRSWGAILACSIGVIFWALFAFRGKAKIAFILLMIAGSLVYVKAFESQPLNYFKSDRMQYMDPAIEMIVMRPVFGWGLSQYKPAFYSIKKNVKKTGFKRTHAHFDFIEQTLETGLPGTIPIIGFVICLFIVFLRAKTAIAMSAMSGAVVLMVNSCSTFLFRTPLAWIFLIYIIIVMKEAQNADQVYRA